MIELKNLSAILEGGAVPAGYNEKAKLCYFQHNMANVEYKVM